MVYCFHILAICTIFIAIAEAKFKVSHKGSCKDDFKSCRGGTVCIGNKKVRRCVLPVEIGGSCDRSVFQKCGVGLECNKYKCIRRLKYFGNCAPKWTLCPNNTVCARLERDEKCVRPMTKGLRCEKNSYWVCKEGLDCVTGRCRDPLIKMGRSCLEKGSVCENGTVCTGKTDNKRCVRPMKKGQKCRKDPFWICEKGYECYKQVCVPPAIPKDRSCVKKGARCVEGTVCTGLSTRKRCVMPMKKGQKCRKDPFWICEKGYECYKQVCVPPAIPKDHSCVKKGSRCVEGTVCTGLPNRKRCVMPMRKGQKCRNDPFWICEDGCECFKGICVPPAVKEGWSCFEDGSRCEAGLLCVGTAEKKRCAKPLKKGGKCWKDPFRVCQKGLKCIEGTCV